MQSTQSLKCPVFPDRCKLDTAPTPRTLTIFTCARRRRQRAQVKIWTPGDLRRLACESYSPTRRARGGPKDVGYKKASRL